MERSVLAADAYAEGLSLLSSKRKRSQAVAGPVSAPMPGLSA